MPGIDQYSPALTDEPIVVWCDQNKATRRAQLAPNWNRRAATEAELVAGQDNVHYVTPKVAHRRFEGIDSQLDAMWGDPTNTHIRPSVGSQYPSTTLPELTGASTDLRTAALGTTRIRWFRPGLLATGTGNITATATTNRFGTFRMGIVAEWTDANSVVHRFVRALYISPSNGTIRVDYRLTGVAWAEQGRGDFSNDMYVDGPLGPAVDKGWRPIAGTEGYVAKRAPALITRVHLSYSVSAPHHNFYFYTRSFSAPATNVRLSQVNNLYSNATGDDRFDYSWIKGTPNSIDGGTPGDASVGPNQLQTDAVTDVKVADVGFAKITVPTGNDGKILRISGNGVIISDESTVDTLGANTVGENAYQNDSMNLATKAKDQSLTGAKCADDFLAPRHFPGRCIPEGTLQTNTVALQELKLPLSAQDGDLVGVSNSRYTLIRPAAWEVIGGVYDPSGIADTAVNLTSGKVWTDYTEIFFWGSDRTASITVPGVVMRASTTTNRIVIPSGDGYCEVFRSGNGQYTFKVVATDASNNGIKAVYAR